ncbi:hypothetical protein G3I60_05055 [Streptomyces sp. SID13666]|uniref:hypothetical protein n=1 Tax=Streptomyces sp. SID13666 TaxID=2706054 RepID=UPI0013C09CEA|nr:hypothetical protein [Streptomyces sp. SID13666]NEA53538.1 hypothetical protein [Streptomyces sp. SID13666]
MQPAVLKALEAWKLSYDDTQEAAATAMRVAYPALESVPSPTGCCEVRLEFATPDSGSGTVCVDIDGRATIQFTGILTLIVSDAIDGVFGLGWFDGTRGESLADAGPGVYAYDCDSSAEYEIVISEHGDAASLHIAYVQVPDAVAILDALTQAAQERQAEAMEGT